MCLSAQNASIERICKAHSVIHTKARNRLNPNLQDKLIYLYVNGRLKNEYFDEEEFDVFDEDVLLND